MVIIIIFIVYKTQLINFVKTILCVIGGGGVEKIVIDLGWK